VAPLHVVTVRAWAWAAASSAATAAALGCTTVTRSASMRAMSSATPATVARSCGCRSCAGADGPLRAPAGVGAGQAAMCHQWTERWSINRMGNLDRQLYLRQSHAQHCTDIDYCDVLNSIVVSKHGSTGALPLF